MHDHLSNLCADCFFKQACEEPAAGPPVAPAVCSRACVCVCVCCRSPTHSLTTKHTRTQPDAGGAAGAAGTHSQAVPTLPPQSNLHLAELARQCVEDGYNDTNRSQPIVKIESEPLQDATNRSQAVVKVESV